ncbi:ATPase [Mycoplasmopsis felis]|uniref:ATPase n=1 Tax=Mycoplasmopsis felis TaxID=33923 RepID=A0A809RS17_9BACT|nr:cation-translocating P-type ATPase [Mycoplasmopsis felis]BBU47735.1 ATPase [Mycoplasmopsis felis]
MINKDYIKNRIGLTNEVANKLLKKNGLNQIKNEKKVNIFKLFLNQFKDFMIILLLIAAVFSLSVAFYETFGKAEAPKTQDIIVSFVEPFIILIVIVLNSLLGTYQEIKSDQAVKALEKNNELYAKVYRDGKLINIPSTELVIGDLIVLEAGDLVPADCKLVESFSLAVVESALTGESLPVDKKVIDENVESNKTLGDRKSEVFAGTHITNGRAIALVIKTGKNTEIGKINQLIQEQEVILTPLQIKLNKLSKIFGILGVLLLFITTVLQLVLTNSFSGIWNNPETYSNSIIIGISLAVAAIPEGLITFTTVLLAIGVSKMTKEHVIIKAFPAVETLGSTSIICSDKTGTLTENKMTVKKFFDAQNKSIKPSDSFALSCLVACCDASVSINSNNEYIEVGDPTETGILRYGLMNDNSADKFYKTYNKLDSIPFDSDRKTMSVLVENINKEKMIIVKGATDVILSKCINKEDRYFEINEEWSKSSYRVIAIAYKNIDKDKISIEDENDLIFLGLIGMIDPPRQNVLESVKQARQAGIKTVMITGDHLTTAIAIAKELEIYQDGNLAINGIELNNMSDQELKDKVKNISVYARVNPIDKLRIVKAWQSHNEVVSMTGDGVNDAAALKASDVGIAMGITGTDVSKQAADVILTDDNFATIVKGIKSGRETFNRIKSVILNLLISSLTEIIVMLVGLFIFSFVFKNQIKESEIIILSASQLLWINLLTHGLPAIALGMTPTDENVMSQKPLNKKDSIFANGMGKELIIQSLIISLASLLSYLIAALVASNKNITGEDFIKITSTSMFIALGVGASINSINLMSKNSIFKCSVKKYKLVYLASLFSLVCVIFVAFTPGVREIFKMTNITELSNNNLYDIAFWLPALLLGFLLTIYNEIVKFFKNTFKKNNKI